MYIFTRYHYHPLFFLHRISHSSEKMFIVKKSYTLVLTQLHHFPYPAVRYRTRHRHVRHYRRYVSRDFIIHRPRLVQKNLTPSNAKLHRGPFMKIIISVNARAGARIYARMRLYCPRHCSNGDWTRARRHKRRAAGKYRARVPIFRAPPPRIHIRRRKSPTESLAASLCARLWSAAHASSSSPSRDRVYIYMYVYTL